jgi:hypothetical protein
MAVLRWRRDRSRKMDRLFVRTHCPQWFGFRIDGAEKSLQAKEGVRSGSIYNERHRRHITQDICTIVNFSAKSTRRWMI